MLFLFATLDRKETAHGTETEIPRQHGHQQNNDDKRKAEPRQIRRHDRKRVRHRTDHGRHKQHGKSGANDSLDNALHHKRKLDKEMASARILHVLDQQSPGEQGKAYRIADNERKDKQQKYADAYDNAIKSNDYQESGNALYFAGMAAQKLGQDAKATEAFEKFLVVAPNDKKADDIRCTLAVSAQKAGNKAKALEYYNQILSNPKYTEVAKAQIAALSK